MCVCVCFCLCVCNAADTGHPSLTHWACATRITSLSHTHMAVGTGGQGRGGAIASPPNILPTKIF